MAGFADTSIVREQITESGLQNGPDILKLVDRILSVLPDTAAEQEILRAAAFRNEIQRLQDRIRADSSILEPVAREVLDLCHDYFHRARTQRMGWEYECVEAIETFSEAVAMLTDDSGEFPPSELQRPKDR